MDEKKRLVTVRKLNFMNVVRRVATFTSRGFFLRFSWVRTGDGRMECEFVFAPTDPDEPILVGAK